MCEVVPGGEIRALERFVVDNADLERLEEIIGEFNLFEAIGAVRQELRHSDTLRFLLDPSAPHGLGDAFLSRFLKRTLAGLPDAAIGPVEIEVVDLSRTEVHREWRNIDILLRNDAANFVVAIENKIGSSEHSNQLVRYRERLEKEYPGARKAFLFLTPEGIRPSDETWVPISYDVVAGALSSVLDTYSSRIGPDVVTLLTHYRSVLRRYVMPESDIAELCRQIYFKHRQALDLIFEHRPDARLRVAEMIRGLIAETEGIVPDHMINSYLRFAPAEWDDHPWQHLGSGWTRTGRLLLFEFQNTEKSLTLVLYIGPGDERARRVLFEALCEPAPRFKGGVSKMRRMWTRGYGKKWLTRSANTIIDEDELKATLDRKWREFLEKDLPRIRDVVESVEWPGSP